MPTREVLVRKTEAREDSCVMCGEVTETLFHIFKECPGTHAIAFASNRGFLLESWNVNPVDEIAECCINPRDIVESLDCRSTSIFLCSFLYYVWMYRNRLLHAGEIDILRTVALLNHAVDDFLEIIWNSALLWVEAQEKWKCLAIGWLKLNTDFAYVDGRACLSVVIMNETGEVVMIQSKLCVCKSANSAELEAILWASKITANEGWSRMEFSSYSASSIKEINDSEEPVLWESRQRVLQIKALRNFWSF